MSRIGSVGGASAVEATSVGPIRPAARRPWWRRTLSVGIALACGAYIVHYFAGHANELEVLRGLSLEAIAGLIGLRLVQHLLQSARYRVIIQRCGRVQLPLLNWFSIDFVGQFLSFIVAQAGNVYRAVRLRRAYQVPYARYVASMLAAAWGGVGVNLLIAVIVVGGIDPTLELGPLSALWLLAAMFVACVMIPPTLVYLGGLVSFRPRALAWLHGKLVDILRMVIETMADSRCLAGVVVLTIAIFCVSCAAFGFGFESFGVEVGLSAIVLFAVLMQISTVVVVTPGNLGIQEVVFGILGLYLNTGLGQAMLLLALLRVIDFACIAALALPIGGLRALTRRDGYVD